ncbi:methyltransferase domain-containing protein [Methanobacterium sp. SMA-27]|uniref:methyltransferase domain-containing protein n=1 Tax=Methanobacterium sp. SMA-27 TaxID=1495336 RepID=UPI0006932DB2|nr:methyltransferase domain-containing protein [Methanobacterium sp. SMA-27]
MGGGVFINLKDVQKNWEGLAQDNPLGAIITSEKNWDLENFFKTGINEINDLMMYLETLNKQISTKKAVDFGCGVGRLTQPLTNFFDKVYGIDISPTMIKLANELFPEDKCEFVLNEKDNLELFENNSMDFVYSNITLLHMEPKYSKKYIKEFLRILEPGGISIFYLPSKALGINKLKTNFVKKSFTSIINFFKDNVVEMYVIKEEEICRLVEEQNGIILDVKRNEEGGYITSRYSVTKN